MTEDARVKQRLQVIHNPRIKLCNSKIYYDNPETVPPSNPTPLLHPRRDQPRHLV